MKDIIKIAGIMALVILSACGNSNPNLKGNNDKVRHNPDVNLVHVMILKKGDFPLQILSNGRLSASRKASLSFSTSGKIASIYVQNGESVSAGEKLAELDRPDLRLFLQSSNTAYNKSEMDLYDILVGQGYMDKDTSSIPEVVLSMARMRSGYQSAKENVAVAKFNLSATVLRAPFSGRIADLKVKKYDDLESGTFCILVDDRVLDVDFTVLESEYPFLSKGLDVKVTPFADDSKIYKGTVTSINPVVDDNGQIQVRARINNDGSLIDGMNVKIVIEKMIHDMLVIPKSAVVSRDNLDVLFKYSNDGKSHWTYIDVLYSNGDSYAVSQNNDRNAILEEGDTIIVSGNLNLADMSDVKIKDN